MGQQRQGNCSKKVKPPTLARSLGRPFTESIKEVEVVSVVQA